MIVVTRISEMRTWVRSVQRAGERIALVPTMGYLHEGHLSLVRQARELAERTVVSIFVNPTQFAPDEDLERYPRDFDRDEALCRDHDVDVVFYPDAAEMYAPDFSTWVSEDALSIPLCGRARPGHFRGVTTVVAKLFNIVSPDLAVFGRKDAQQALVIQRMVRDLNFPVDIVTAPIVREPDGLAMSSRNRYLSDDDRGRAGSIHRGLTRAQNAFDNGEDNVNALTCMVREEIAGGGGVVEYVELLARETLTPFDDHRVTAPALLAVAAFFGETRLIDNVFLG